ncbi:hypothetical protein PR048_003201 [Dryococelus australis]|uniref:Uncharacterized protein n=1 Tax=Dryococelus australis TaxID=614101 RepID=A0ABQ9IPK9_9NEOP|nr:hypothetical protein PR048_003201 [Dryococelus australis]
MRRKARGHFSAHLKEESVASFSDRRGSITYADLVARDERRVHTPRTTHTHTHVMRAVTLKYDCHVVTDLVHPRAIVTLTADLQTRVNAHAAFVALPYSVMPGENTRLVFFCRYISLRCLSRERSPEDREFHRFLPCDWTTTRVVDGESTKVERLARRGDKASVELARVCLTAGAFRGLERANNMQAGCASSCLEATRRADVEMDRGGGSWRLHRNAKEPLRARLPVDSSIRLSCVNLHFPLNLTFLFHPFPSTRSPRFRVRLMEGSEDKETCEVSMEQDGTQEQGEPEISEKTRQPVASSGTIPTCENSGATQPVIEPGWTCCALNPPYHSASLASGDCVLLGSLHPYSVRIILESLLCRHQTRTV